MQVSVNELKRCPRMVGRGRKRIGMHFASKARLTNGIRRSVGVNENASNQVLGDHLLNISMIMMPKTSMPQGEVSRKGRDVIGNF